MAPPTEPPDVPRGTPSRRVSDTSDTPVVDVTDYLTKAEAAAAIGCSTKRIERLVKRRELSQAWRTQSPGVDVVVYRPDDVARLAAEAGRPPPPPTTVVLPATAEPRTITRVVNPAPDAVTVSRADVLAFLAELRGRGPEPLVFTVPEAAAWSHWPESYLRRCIADGTLPAVKARAWLIRRRDLEAL